MQIPWWGQQTEWRLAWGTATLHYDTENDISTVVTETVMVSNLLARFKGWDLGVTSSVWEESMQQAEHIGYL